MKTTLLLLLMSLSLSAFAQKDSTRHAISVSPFTAQFMISTNTEAVCFNMIGSGIRYSKNHTVFSLTIFPTLIFKKDVPIAGEPKKPFVRPGFAVGPMFMYKRVMFGLPVFYQDDVWHVTVGCGVKIGK